MMSTRRFHTIFLSMVILFAVGLDAAGGRPTEPKIPLERKQALYAFYCQKRDSNSLEGLDLNNDEVLDGLVSEFIQHTVTIYADRRGSVSCAEKKHHLLRDELKALVVINDATGFPLLGSPDRSPKRSVKWGRMDRRGSPDSLPSSSQTLVTKVSSPRVEAGAQKDAPSPSLVHHDTEGGQRAATPDKIHPDHMTSTQKIHRHVPKVIGSSAVLFFASLVREAAKLQGIAVTRKLQLVKETLGQEFVSSWPKAFGLAMKRIVTAGRRDAKMLRASLALLIGSISAWVANRNY